jgi:hypothetical protein
MSGMTSSGSGPWPEFWLQAYQCKTTVIQGGNTLLLPLWSMLLLLALTLCIGTFTTRRVL